MHFVLQFLLDFQFYLEQRLRSSKVVKNGVNNKCTYIKMFLFTLTLSNRKQTELASHKRQSVEFRVVENVCQFKADCTDDYSMQP